MPGLLEPVAPVMDISQLVDTHQGGGWSVLWGVVPLCGSGSLGRPLHRWLLDSRPTPTCVFQRWELPSVASPPRGPAAFSSSRKSGFRSSLGCPLDTDIGGVALL